jgi:hypothetical protein
VEEVIIRLMPLPSLPRQRGRVETAYHEAVDRAGRDTPLALLDGRATEWRAS